MCFKSSFTIPAVATVLACANTHGQIINDDFQSYAVGTFRSFVYGTELAIIAEGTWSSSEGGQCIFNPDNGHYYELVTDQVLWPDAERAAKARLCEGMYGHLATITSESENNFIVEIVMGCVVTSAYIGGFQPEGSPEPDGGWRWVTEEPFGYNNWGSGQPDQNGGEDENAIELKGLCSAFPYDWHDQAGDTDFFPYIVEFSPPPCPGDLNDDGSVGAFDLLILLGFWGPCKGCPADFDGDGNVGASDLLALLANWGPCP